MSIQAPISHRTMLARAAWQAPVVVVLLGLAILALGGRIELLGAAYLALVTPELCRIDSAEHRLPNAIVLPALALAVAGPVLGWAVTGAPPTGALLAGAASGFFLVVMHIAGGLGMGDVKLGTALGLGLGCLGPVAALAGPVIGFLAGGAAALIALLVPALGLGHRMPFGPFLLFGYWAAIMLMLLHPVGQ
ncbi:MAG TPA: prepilin peptidase [Humibacter sp.]|nr:prepilin peptidase [Humibacter sp.]